MPKVKDNKENSNKCQCAICPSYTACLKQKMENLFCARGKSDCKVPINGCNCGICSVHRENNLRQGYYCIEGSAEEIEK